MSISKLVQQPNNPLKGIKGTGVTIGNAVVDFDGSTDIKSKLLAVLNTEKTLPVFNASSTTYVMYIIGKDTDLGKVYFKIERSYDFQTFEYDVYTNTIRELEKLRGVINAWNYGFYDPINKLIVIRYSGYNNSYYNNLTSKMGTYNVLTDETKQLVNCGATSSNPGIFSYDYATGRMFLVGGSTITVYNYLTDVVNTSINISAAPAAGTNLSCYAPSDNRVYYFNITGSTSFKVSYYDFDTSTAVASTSITNFNNAIGNLLGVNYSPPIYNPNNQRIYFMLYQDTTNTVYMYSFQANNAVNPSSSGASLWTGNAEPQYGWDFDKNTNVFIFKNPITASKNITVVTLHSNGINTSLYDIPFTSLGSGTSASICLLGDTIFVSDTSGPYGSFSRQIYQETDKVKYTGKAVAIIQNLDTASGAIVVKIDGKTLSFQLLANSTPLVLQAQTSFEIISFSTKIHVVWGEF